MWQLPFGSPASPTDPKPKIKRETLPLGRGSVPDEEFAATVLEITTVRPETNTLTDAALEMTTAELALTTKGPEVANTTASPADGLFYPSSYYDPSNTLIDTIYITTERAAMESTANATRAKKSPNEFAQLFRPDTDERTDPALGENELGKDVNAIPEPKRRVTPTRNQKPSPIEISSTSLERSNSTRLPTTMIMSNLIVVSEMHSPTTEQDTPERTDTSDPFEATRKVDSLKSTLTSDIPSDEPSSESEISFLASPETERSEEIPESAENEASIEQSAKLNNLNEGTSTKSPTKPKASPTSKSIWPGLTPPYAYAPVYGYPAHPQSPSLWQFINEPIQRAPSVFIPSQQFEVDGFGRFIPISGE